MYQVWKDRHGYRGTTDISREDLATFCADWSREMSRMVGRSVTAGAVEVQLRFGFTRQLSVCHNHMHNWLGNKTAAMEAGLMRSDRSPQGLSVRW